MTRHSLHSLLLSLCVVQSCMLLVACDGSTPQQQPTIAAPEGPKTTPTPTPAQQGPLFVVFESMSGKVRVQLHTKEAPRTCANFLNLIHRRYYVGKTWDDFSPVVRQLGEPMTQSEIPYAMPREFAPKLLFDVGGRLCLSNTSERDDARGHPYRIFLTVKPQERWNLVYVVFGTIVEGLDVATRMVPGEPVASITIEGDPAPLLAAQAKNIEQWNAALDRKRE